MEIINTRKEIYNKFDTEQLLEELNTIYSYPIALKIPLITKLLDSLKETDVNKTVFVFEMPGD